MKDGVEGLWKFAEEQLKNLHTMVINQIIEFVQAKVIKKVIVRLAVFFIPFAGLIAAAKTLWDAIKFIKENIERFRRIAETILDVIEPAARGDAGPAAGKVEEMLARLLPLAIEFLAKLVGLGDLDNKIKGILEKVQKPVNKAIDWCIDKVLQGIDWLKSKVKSIFGGKDDEVEQAKQEIGKKDVSAKTTGKDGQPTELKVDGNDDFAQAPQVNFDDGDNAGAVGLGKPTKLSPESATDGAGVIDQFTDLGAKSLAAEYPDLGSTISDKERIAQEKMENSVPALSVELPASNGKPTQKATIKLSTTTINDAIQAAHK